MVLLDDVVAVFRSGLDVHLYVVGFPAVQACEGGVVNVTESVAIT